jgi:glycine oxidase
MQHPDICIAGAGIIGLSLALELHHRGARVTVLERDAALSHTSIAAAGMLAANDPENPSELKPLSTLSVALYPEFLSRIEALADATVPFQTSRTFQAHESYPNLFDPTLLPQLHLGAHHFAVLDEHSLDPRQLAAALLASVRRTSIQLLEHTTLHMAISNEQSVHIDTSSGSIEARQIVHTRGAWSFAPVTPRKGQMLVVALPPSLPLRDVIRTPDIYIVPRLFGPRAGNALIGATIEDAGFDTHTHPSDLACLRRFAADLLPALGDETLAPESDHWAGLRPATPDALPLLGPLPGAPGQFVATGHYRNGILLAPATARVMAQLLQGENPTVDLSTFAPSRFSSPA